MSMKESMLLLSSLKRGAETLTRLLGNGRPRLMTLLLKMKPAKKSVAITTVNSLDLKLLGMKLLSNLILSSGRTRILLMRSRIFLTNLVMEEGPSMNLTNKGVALK